MVHNAQSDSFTIRFPCANSNSLSKFRCFPIHIYWEENLLVVAFSDKQFNIRHGRRLMLDPMIEKGNRFHTHVPNKWYLNPYCSIWGTYSISRVITPFNSRSGKIGRIKYSEAFILHRDSHTTKIFLGNLFLSWRVPIVKMYAFKVTIS